MHLKISRNLYALFGSNLIIHFRQEFVETFRFEVSNLVNKIKGVIRDFSSHAPVKIAACCIRRAKLTACNQFKMPFNNLRPFYLRSCFLMSTKNEARQM